MAFKQLILPETLSKERVVVVIYRPQEGKMGSFIVQMKDDTYYPEFRKKYAFFGTQVHEGEKLEKAISRRLKKEIPDAADEIVEKMYLWKGLRLSWQQVPGEYFCHVFLARIDDYKEWEDLWWEKIHGKGTKQGIPYRKTREEVERMSQINDDFMAGLGQVAALFLQEFDAGRI